MTYILNLSYRIRIQMFLNIVSVLALLVLVVSNEYQL